MDIPFAESAARLPSFTARLEEDRRRGRHIGAQVYISLAGEVIADFGWGEARPGQPMESDTLMIWLSSGKPLAAVAIAQCVERGKLAWEQRVANIIPEFAQGGKEAITVSDLLTHTCGFRSADVLWNDLGWEDNLARVYTAPLEAGWIVGETAGYHISGSWFVLGEIIRRLDGRDYSRYLREEVLLPLGMKDTWSGMPGDVYQAYGNRIGRMHDTSRGAAREHPFWDTELGCFLPRPGANTHGPIRELGLFYERMLALLSGRGQGPITSASAQTITSRRRQGKLDLTFKATVDWGLGFILNTPQPDGRMFPYGFGRYASPDTFGHSGSQSSTGFADPAHRLVVAWVCNGTPGAATHHERAQALNEAVYADLDLLLTSTTDG